MLKKIVGGTLTVVLLLVLALVAKFYLLSPRMRPALDLKASQTPEAFLRGRYLVDNVAGCLGCHSQIDEAVSGEPPVPGRLGSGRDFGSMPGFPGHIRAPNLTPDPDTGIGKWSDGELVRAIREGVSRDGRPLFPMMPYGTYGKTLNDEDALAVVSYFTHVACDQERRRSHDGRFSGFDVRARGPRAAREVTGGRACAGRHLGARPVAPHRVQLSRLSRFGRRPSSADPRKIPGWRCAHADPGQRDGVQREHQ